MKAHDRTKGQKGYLGPASRSLNDRLGERLKSERALFQSWGRGLRVVGLMLITLAASAAIYTFH